MEFIAVFLAYCTLTEQVLLSKNQFKETLLEVINALLLWRMKKKIKWYLFLLVLKTNIISFSICILFKNNNNQKTGKTTSR